VQVVAVHIVLKIYHLTTQEQIEWLVDGHLRKFVVYLLYLAYNAVERYHVAHSTRSDKVRTDNLDIGHRRNLILKCTETEYEVFLSNSIILALLRVNDYISRHEKYQAIDVASLHNKLLTRL
jgi:hypothetical protein